MIKYKATEVTLSYEGNTISANATVSRSIDEGPWVEVDSIILSLAEMKCSREIARVVLQAVRKVARKDFVTNVLLEEASDFIYTKEFEFVSES